MPHMIPKMICLSCRPNNLFDVLNWSFDKELSNLMHEGTSCQSQMKSLSWVLDDKWKCKSELVCRSHEKFDEEKLWVWWNVLWVEMENGEVNGNLSFETRKFLSLECFCLWIKTCLSDVRFSFPHKNVFVLST